MDLARASLWNVNASDIKNGSFKIRIYKYIKKYKLSKTKQV